jgi:hypothetical protein
VFVGCNCTQVKLTEVTAEGVRFEDCQLNHANLDKGSFTQAVFKQCNLERASVEQAKLRSADFSNARVPLTVFQKADLRETTFDNCDGHSCQLTEADLTRASLYRARLAGANLDKASVAGVNFLEADLTSVSLRDVKGVTHAKNLERVDLRPDARYFETCERGWWERNCDWESLRRIGNLPLFAISYTALLLIPLYVYAVAAYNQKVELARDWAGKVGHSHAGKFEPALGQFAEVTQDKLKPLPTSWRTWLAFISTVLLAIASTIYRLRCPDRVQEFTRTKWCDELRHSLLHYWPLSWRERWVRIPCGSLYVVGGVLGLSLILVKLWDVFWLILENTHIK